MSKYGGAGVNMTNTKSMESLQEVEKDKIWWSQENNAGSQREHFGTDQIALISRITGDRSRDRVAGHVIENSKSEFQRICEDNSWKLIVGKLDPILRIRRRKIALLVAMLVRSPVLKYKELGVHKMESGTPLMSISTSLPTLTTYQPLLLLIQRLKSSWLSMF